MLEELNEFLDEDGRLGIAPTDTKTQEDLDRVVGLGKPQRVIDRHIALVDLTNAWDWCYAYIYYVNRLHDWDDWTAPEPLLDEEGVPLPLEEKPDEPVEPIRKVVEVIPYRNLRKVRYIKELSEEGTFENTTGDMLDALMDAMLGDTTKLLALKAKVDKIKTDIPKPTEPS